MTENFPELVKGIDITSPRNAENPKQDEPTPRHNIIKIPKVKDKERIFKAARKKQLVSCEGAPVRMSAHFSPEALQG